MKQSADSGQPGLQAWTIGTASWPQLAVEPSIFELFLSERDPPLPRLSAEIVGDLYLVCACLHDVPGAVESFIREISEPVRLAARGCDTSPTFADEVVQQLHEHLLVGIVARNRLLQYRGASRLGGWVARIAWRIALRLAMKSAPRRFLNEDALVAELERQEDAETRAMRSDYREVFRESVMIGLRQLSARDRMILRLHIVDGLSMARIALMHQVSQPTISRWLRDARMSVLRSVRDSVQNAFEIETGEVGSVVNMMASQLEISFSQIFGDALPNSKTEQNETDAPL